MQKKNEINLQNRLPKSACEELDDMLANYQKVTRERVGGGIGYSTNGNVVGMRPSTSISFEQDTNSLTRAEIACQRGLLVSPMSYVGKNRNTLFIKQELYEQHLEQAGKISDQEPKGACNIQ